MIKKANFKWLSLVLLFALGGVALWEQQPNTNTVQPANSTPPLTTKQVSAPAANSFAIRGVVEGFYGEPWSHEQRLDMLRFMGEHHFNTYVYAPKDDPYQRRQWSALYPPDLQAEMRSLVQAAEQSGIRFVYSISPGIPAPLPAETFTSEWVNNSITLSSKADQQRLIQKLDQLRALGIHEFMLSFDDVKEMVKPEDRATYGRDYAKAHVDLANAIYEYESPQDPDFTLWFTPTDYYGLEDSPYWQAIRTSLHPQISVLWTGEWVLNQNITTAEAQTVEQLLGRKPLLWDNYPVNDYTYALKQRPQLLMGPLENRAPDLVEHLSGYVTNPMIQPQASKVALSTIGEYLDSPASYSPDLAWEHAVQSLAALADPDALLLFSRYSQESTLRRSGNPDFAKMTTRYWRDRDPAVLRQEFQALAQLPSRLHTSETSPALLREIDPWLNKLGQIGQTGLLALDYLQSPSPDPKRAQKGMQLFFQVQRLSATEEKIGEEIVHFLQKACQS